jgi:hypothetical protein
MATSDRNNVNNSSSNSSDSNKISTFSCEKLFHNENTIHVTVVCESSPSGGTGSTRAGTGGDDTPFYSPVALSGLDTIAQSTQRIAENYCPWILYHPSRQKNVMLRYSTTTNDDSQLHHSIDQQPTIDVFLTNHCNKRIIFPPQSITRDVLYCGVFVSLHYNDTFLMDAASAAPFNEVVNPAATDDTITLKTGAKKIAKRPPVTQVPLVGKKSKSPKNNDVIMDGTTLHAKKKPNLRDSTSLRKGKSAAAKVQQSAAPMQIDQATSSTTQSAPVAQKGERNPSSNKDKDNGDQKTAMVIMDTADEPRGISNPSNIVRSASASKDLLMQNVQISHTPKPINQSKESDDSSSSSDVSSAPKSSGAKEDKIPEVIPNNGTASTPKNEAVLLRQERTTLPSVATDPKDIDIQVAKKKSEEIPKPLVATQRVASLEKQVDSSVHFWVSPPPSEQQLAPTAPTIGKTKKTKKKNRKSLPDPISSKGSEETKKKPKSSRTVKPQNFVAPDAVTELVVQGIKSIVSAILPSGEEASPAVATATKKRKNTAGTAALTKEKKKRAKQSDVNIHEDIMGLGIIAKGTPTNQPSSHSSTPKKKSSAVVSVSNQKDDADSYQQQQQNTTTNPQKTVTIAVTHYPKQPASQSATSNVDSSSEKDGTTLLFQQQQLTTGIQKTAVSKSAKRKAKQPSSISTTNIDATAAASSGNQKVNTVLLFQQQQHATVAEKTLSNSSTYTSTPKQPATHSTISDVDESASNKKDDAALSVQNAQQHTTVAHKIVSDSAKDTCRPPGTHTTSSNIDATTIASSGNQRDDAVLLSPDKQHAADSRKTVSDSGKDTSGQLASHSTAFNIDKSGVVNTMEYLTTLTRLQLKELCKIRKIPVSGPKKDLIDRLMNSKTLDETTAAL